MNQNKKTCQVNFFMLIRIVKNIIINEKNINFKGKHYL